MAGFDWATLSVNRRMKIRSRTSNGLDAAEAKPPAAGELNDEQVSELERLAKLKQEGILTDEEFAAEKKKILRL